jgi:tetratricopeptide (TPR) repeat protein
MGRNVFELCGKAKDPVVRIFNGNAYFGRRRWDDAAAYYDRAAEMDEVGEARVVALFLAIETVLKIGDRVRAYEEVRVMTSVDFDTLLWLHDPLVKKYCVLPHDQLGGMVSDARQFWSASASRKQ